MIHLQIGFNAPHDRNENASPSSAMLAHPHPQQQQQQQHQQSVSQSSMSYNVQVNSAHKNISSSSTSTGAYSIQNMKEEPNAGANSYSNAVNGSGADDMAVSVTFVNISKKEKKERKICKFNNLFFFFLNYFPQSFGLFQHPGAYDEPEYHSLSQDAQNQPPFLENSPEFYAGMLEQKYNQPYHKNPFNTRGKFSYDISFTRFELDFTKAYDFCLFLIETFEKM